MAVEIESAEALDHGADVDDRLTLANYRIRDRESFDLATNDSRALAGLYFYFMLDDIIELALDVARDFFNRPQLFTASGDPPLAPLLAELNAVVGHDPRRPSRAQRYAIYIPLFGDRTAVGDEADDFARLCSDITEAAIAFAERSFDTGIEMLRERVRSAHRLVQDYLTGLHGASVRWSRTEALPGLTEELAYAVLRNDAASAVYGFPTAPRKDWPYTEDPNGDKLIEELSKRSVSVVNLTRERFSNMQRAALRGTEAIATILDFNEHHDDRAVDRLITVVYTWGTALTTASMNRRTNHQPALMLPSS